MPSGSSGARYNPFSFVTTARSAPVFTLVIVTVTPGRTPPDVSEIVPSMAPFAAVDCAKAGTAAAHADTSTAKKYLSMIASIPTKTRGSAPESERRVAWIHFFEVVAQHDAAREERAGHAVTGVAESEQVVRKV